ncbi:hypothetical protein P879_10908 [Paragonimus westermani]|uniref:Uncharacterized protein n=1 Tax=Paragonimus westermani TaxID=34504 RepID=A0A8T0DB65_9TREM|nr:hypothetical protein P879_10908 [Paragonimus westermani]
MASNGTPIHTYGQRPLLLNLGLRREDRWVFAIVDVRQLIVGADFITHYNLWIELRRERLLDANTQLSAKGRSIFTSSVQPLLPFPPVNSVYVNLLRKFPEMTKPNFRRSCLKRSITQSMITNGNPVFVRFRRLPPDRYAKAKDEFQHTPQLGIIRSSKSMWASPLTMVPKKTTND